MDTPLRAKHKAIETLEHPKGKLIAVDLDNTLSIGEWWGEHHGEPKLNQPMYDKLMEWYYAGAHIIIWTARNPSHFLPTLAWLTKHNVPYHGIAMQKKVLADVFIDDRALNVDDVVGTERCVSKVKETIMEHPFVRKVLDYKP